MAGTKQQSALALDANERKQVRDAEVDKHLREAVKIDPDNVDETLVRVAADLSYYANLHADAIFREKNAELAVKETAARLNITHRERLILEAPEEVDAKGKSKGRKAPTVDAVKAAVETDPEYVDVVREYIFAEVEAVRARGRLDAVRAVKDTAIQIALTRRAEIMIDPSTAANHREQRFARRLREEAAAAAAEAERESLATQAPAPEAAADF